MRMKIHQGRIARKVIVRGVNTEMRISNGRTRHVQRINNFLKVGGGEVGGDLISKNNERLDGGKKSKTHCIFN